MEIKICIQFDWHWSFEAFNPLFPSMYGINLNLSGLSESVNEFYCILYIMYIMHWLALLLFSFSTYSRSQHLSITLYLYDCENKWNEMEGALLYKQDKLNTKTKQI